MQAQAELVQAQVLHSLKEKVQKLQAKLLQTSFTEGKAELVTAVEAVVGEVETRAPRRVFTTPPSGRPALWSARSNLEQEVQSTERAAELANNVLEGPAKNLADEMV